MDRIIRDLNVLKKDANGTREIGMQSSELENHIIWIEGEITDQVAYDFIRKLMYIEMDNSDKPVKIYITSSGGSVSAGLSMYDAIQSSKLLIKTIAVQKAYSMGAILLIAGKERYIFPNSKVMIHEPMLSGNTSGNIKDYESMAKNLKETHKKLIEILCRHTKKTAKEMEKATSYDHYFTAEEAVEFGLVDRIVGFDTIINEL